MEQLELNDEIVLTYIKHYRETHKVVSDHYMDNNIVNYINNRFDDCCDFREALYRLENHLEEKPKCIICGKPTTWHKWLHIYNKHCCNRCAQLDVDVQNKIKATNNKKYGCDNVFQAESIKEKIKASNIKKYGVSNPQQNKKIKEKTEQTNKEKYGVLTPLMLQKSKDKSQQTNLERYGCKSSLGNKKVQEKIRQTNLEKYGNITPLKNTEVREKCNQTNLERYGTIYPIQNKEIQEKQKATFINHYGVEHPMKNNAIVEKVYNSRKVNHTLNTSKQEEKCYSMLCEKFGEDDVKRQYKSEVYPFHCDFYIQSKDLYIECNFHWSHGSHPFNPLNESDREKISYWKSKNTKYYNSVIKVWTQRDPLKLQIAKLNNLNYKVFYSIDEFYEWFILYNQ